MKFDHRDIEYFAAIATHGHIGRAAESLGIGQPALSIALRRLECAADAKLVERTPRGVVLTSVGAGLIRHVDRLRLAREDLGRELADLAHGEAGSLRIGASPSNTFDPLPLVCRTLLLRSPKLELVVSVHDNDALIPALRRGDLDIVIGHRQQLREPDLTEVLLRQDEFVVYCAKSHSLAKRKQLKLADLARERWVLTEANALGPWLSLRHFFSERGLPPPRLAMLSPSPTVNLRTVADSPLLGISNRRNVLDARAMGLVVLPVQDLEWKRDAVLMHRKDGYLSPLATRFIRELKAASQNVHMSM